MPEPITTIIQGFAFGIAQNLISTVIQELKVQRDGKEGAKTRALFEQRERSKEIETRIAQTVCAALRNSRLSDGQFQLLLPLASDPILSVELSRQVLENTYSPDSLTQLISSSAGWPAELGNHITELSSILVTAIENAIADDPHLKGVKDVRFQRQVTVQLAASHERLAESLDSKFAALTQQLDEGFMAQRLLSDGTSELRILERIYHDRVDRSRDLLARNKPKSAKALLEELRQEVARQPASPSLLFRIATNLGSCAIQLGESDVAIREIEAAFQSEPENPKAMTNLSIVCMLKDDPAQALQWAERARQLLPQDSLATASYIQALFALGRETEVDRLSQQESWIGEDIECCLTWGTLLFNQGKDTDAERVLRLISAVRPQRSQVLVTLARVILRPLQQSLIRNSLLKWRFPQEITTRLLEVEELLSGAILLEGDLGRQSPTKIGPAEAKEMGLLCRVNGKAT